MKSPLRPLPWLLLAAACALGLPARATEFSVSPIRVELKPGVMSETITVTNHADTKLRVAIRLTEWTQDADGKDVYKDSSELIWFPRQMEVEPHGKRLVRLGARTPAGVVERTYRLWVEEEPPPGTGSTQAQVAFYFRFGVPVFLVPAVGKPQAEFGEPRLAAGRLALPVKNTGNQSFRLQKITVSDEAGFTHEVAGWYSLAGTERTYVAEIPREVCRRAKVLTIAIEGEGIRSDRKLHVDPASCP
jgi:fimbrial chaperone protein